MLSLSTAHDQNTSFADPTMHGSFRQTQPSGKKSPSFWSFIVLAGVFDAKVKVLSEAIKPTSRKRKCAKKACSRRRDPGVDLVAPRDEMLACKERLKDKAQAAPCLRRSLG